MLKTVCFGLLLGLTFGTTAQAQNFNSRIDIDDGVLIIETDATHDLVSCTVDPNDDRNLLIQIAHYIEQPDLLSLGTTEQALQRADDSRVAQRRFDRFRYVVINVFEGNDVVFIQPDLEVSFVVVGGEGDDYIMGGAGSDYLCGDHGPVPQLMAGPDYLYENPEGPLDVGGNDIVFGNGGNDVLYGGPLNDQLKGGFGDDLLFGGTGNDDLFGEDGRDRLSGDEDDDFLDGGFDSEIDWLSGGTGADGFRSTRYSWYWTTVEIIGRKGALEHVRRKRQEIHERDEVVDFDMKEGDYEQQECLN